MWVLCALSLSLCLSPLSLFLSRSGSTLTALANNEIYLNSPTHNQLVCLFCMFVALTLSSPSHSHSHSTNRANYRNNLFCIIRISGRVCFSLSLSISLNRLQAHTQNNTKKKQKKQTLYRKLFLFWTLTQSYDDFVLPHLRERDARRRGGREGEGGVLILMLSCLHARSRSCFRSLARTHSLSRSRLARDKCFVSGQIKIEASGDGTYYLIAHVQCTFVPNLTYVHAYTCISTLICCALDMETD